MTVLKSLFICVLAAGHLIHAQQYLRKSEWGSYRCPVDNGTLPSPTYHNERVVFTACSQRLINAPVERVYDTLIYFADYEKWNSFVRKVDNVNGSSLSPAGLYTEMVFHNYGLFPPSNIEYPAHEIVSVLQNNETGFAVAAWKYDDQLGGTILRAEHTNVLTTNGEGDGTVYVSWDSYYGFTANAFEPILAGNLREQFSKQADDLKRYVESSP